MKNLKDLRAMTVNALGQELLVIRKDQFKMRLKKSSGTLENKHNLSLARKTVARIKTLLTEKAGE